MPISPHFDHYEILTPLGKGGMGEVYKARDTRLNREVAIKVLPGEVAHDPERLQRFEQEARATSALNHPNILTVYDFGNYEGNPYLVMELLEGDELRAQLDNGALPVRKAIDYAQQIAAGLAAAHEKNIVHRDLKPENLFVTNAGRVKILDFGLAKLRAPRNVSAGSDVATQKQLTNPGTVMGTVAYMSPEQVRGQTLDHRSDIFSFGIILYEMLSGKRAFAGELMADVMSAITRDDPPELTNAKISPALEQIVRRCLEKKPEQRFHSAHDLGFALSTLTMPGSSGNNRTEAAPALPTTAIPPRSGNRERFAWIGFVVASLLALLAFSTAYFRHPALEAEPMRLFVNPPEKATRFDYPTISPDGRTLAFFAIVEGKNQLWIRPLNSTTAKPLATVADPVVTGLPFWSPDSQFIVFFEDGKIKKIAVVGGIAETLCDTQFAGGGTWNREGVILFGTGPAGIKRVSANGGTVTAVTIVDSSGAPPPECVAPVFLPDGQHFIFFHGGSDPAKRGAYLTSLADGKATQLLPTDNRVVGVATSLATKNEGYLVFMRQGILLAQSFDFSRNQLVGEPVRLSERVPTPIGGFARFSLAAQGTLVMIEGNVNRQLTWVDRAGKKLGTIGSPGIYLSLRLSPDEQRLAVSRRDQQTQNQEIRLLDLAQGTDMRFTFEPAPNTNPIWSPDGSRIVWQSNREGTSNLYQKAASGTGQDEALLRSTYQTTVQDWSADGRFILYLENHPQTNQDLWILPMEGERKPWPWLNTKFREDSARFSPDGKWIAYTSTESGRSEVYLQAFVPGAPASGSKQQLSTNGGVNPRWQRDGRELYYLSVDSKLMAVDVTLGADVKVGPPKELFALSSIRSAAGFAFTLTGDGQRFLFVTNAEDASVPPFTVVTNWMAEVKK